MQSVEKIHELCQQSSGKDLKIQVAALVAQGEIVNVL